MIRSKDSECRAHQRVLAVGDRLGLEALEAEVEHDELANVRVVFDDEDACHSSVQCSTDICSGRASGAGWPQFFHIPATALPR